MKIGNDCSELCLGSSFVLHVKFLQQSTLIKLSLLSVAERSLTNQKTEFTKVTLPFT